jgi:hypothetical protein
MLAELLFESGPPRRQLESQTIIDHGEAARRRQRDALPIGAGDVFAFVRRTMCGPGLGREPGDGIVEFPSAQGAQKISGEDDSLPLPASQAFLNQVIDAPILASRTSAPKPLSPIADSFARS